MTYNTISILAILFVFVLIGATVFTLRGRILLKMAKPLVLIMDWLFAPIKRQKEMQKFYNTVDEINRQYHQSFLRSTGVKAKNYPNI